MLSEFLNKSEQTNKKLHWNNYIFALGRFLQEEGACNPQFLDTIELLLVFCSCTIALAHPKQRKKKWKLVVFLLCGLCRQGRCISKGRTRHSCHRPPMFLQSNDRISYKYLISGGQKEACWSWRKRKGSCHSYVWERMGDNLCPCYCGRALRPSPLLGGWGGEWKANGKPISFLLVKCGTHSGRKGIRLWREVLFAPKADPDKYIETDNE